MKKYYFSMAFALLFSDISFGQSEAPVYRRSSLHMMMVDNPTIPNKEVIDNAFKTSPFPDKYDKLNYSTDNTGNVMGIAVEERTKAEINAMSKEDKKKYKRIGSNDRRLNKYFNESKTANALVAQWFNRGSDGSFDFSVIADRGEYNASQLDVQKAETQSRSVSTQLADAGHELIGNTFVVVNNFDFYENEKVAYVAYEIAMAACKNIESDLARGLAEAAAEAAYERARKGYTVRTDSYLYQLDWSDSVQAMFYNYYWVDENTSPEEREKRIKLFNESDLFQLKFLDMQEFKRVIFNLGAKDKTKEEIITQATIRSMSRAFSTLQKENDVFKPKVPLYQAEGKRCSAKIGMKESLEGKEKFEVLEQRINKKTGKTEYKSIGKLKVNKKKIWDNRFYVTNNTEEPTDVEDVVKKNIDDEPLEATWFKGCKKKYYPGLLIRQVK